MKPEMAIRDGFVGGYLSIFKPSRKNVKKDLIEQALRDVDPLLRDKAREILEALSEDELKDPDKVKETLRRRNIV